MIRLSEAFPQALGDWLFHIHPMVLLVMVVVAIALLWRWQQTRNARLFMGGGSIVVAGILWVSIAWMVVTPGERLQSDIQNILNAATHQDTVKIAQYLSPNAVLDGWDKTQIVSELNYRLSHMRLTANYLRSMHMRRQGRHAQTNIVVLSIARNYGPFITRWRLIWQDHARPRSWQMTQLQLQSINNSNTSPEEPLGPSP